MSNSIAPLSVPQAMLQNLLTSPGFAWGMTLGATEGTYQMTKGWFGDGAVVSAAVAGRFGAVGGTILGLVSPIVPVFTQEIGANGPIDRKWGVWTNETVTEDVRRSFVR
jgi:hypothetical protein